MNQESENQVRPISFFLIIQKSVKNGTKNSLKKLTFTTFRPTHVESFFRKFEVTAFLFTKLSTDSEKLVHFSRKRRPLPTCLPHTGKVSHCPFYCLCLAGKLDENLNFFKLWFDQTGNRTQIYCISSSRFIHSTTDKK